MAWFRVYDGLVDDPKVQRLSDYLFRILINLWCVAKQNSGTLPGVDDLAFRLRLTAEETNNALGVLHKHGLIDEAADGSLTPHNWNGRQFDSDVSTARVKRFRAVSRNAVKSFHETPPEQRQRQSRRKKDSLEPSLGFESLSSLESQSPKKLQGANGLPKGPLTAAEAEEVALFERGKVVLGKDAGSLIAKLLKAKGGSIAQARAAIEQASTKQSPREYIGGVIRGPPPDNRNMTGII